MINDHLNGRPIPEIPTEAEERKALMRCHFQLALAEVCRGDMVRANEQLLKAERFADGKNLMEIQETRAEWARLAPKL